MGFQSALYAPSASEYDINLVDILQLRLAAGELVSPPLHSVLQYLPISIHKHWTKLMSKCREQFLSYANCFETIPHQWLAQCSVSECVCPPPWLLTPPLTGVSTPVCARAWNEGYMKVREDFIERAPTRAFSWLKAPTSAFTFKTLLRHYAKQALTPW